MYFSDIKKLDTDYIANTYARFDLDIQSGSGVVGKDSAGKEYIDFSSGIGVNSLGFINDKWVAAVTEQISSLNHISNLYYTTPMVKLAKALCEKTGMKKVFFANSGAESNEGAIKTARKYSSDKYSAERCEIIALQNSFHGRTIATLAATGQDVFHKNFGPFPAGFVFAEANDIEDLNNCVTDKTCAIMIECIQGEGGVVPLEEAFVAEVQKLCDEKDLLLVVDEVQTGIGRTGRFLCGEYFGLKPDVITLAKGLGGGLPIGAVLFGEKCQYTLAAGDHGSTFGGNPIVCAGALAVIEAVDGKFLDSVVAKGDYYAKKLAEIDGVLGVSGKGMMIGVTIPENVKSADVAKLCIKKGLVVLTAKAKIRFLPPLTISYDDIDKGLSLFAEALAEAIAEANETEAQ